MLVTVEAVLRRVGRSPRDRSADVVLYHRRPVRRGLEKHRPALKMSQILAPANVRTPVERRSALVEQESPRTATMPEIWPRPQPKRVSLIVLAAAEYGGLSKLLHRADRRLENRSLLVDAGVHEEIYFRGHWLIW